jgi:hypothetical protein
MLGVSVAAAVLLAGCGGDDSDAPADDASTAAEDYLPVPEGVELTAPGSELEVGEAATVAWEPDQETVGVLDITVTRMERASYKLFVGWKVSEENKQKTPYFVHAKVTNVGDTGLGGVQVPLYGVDGDNRLLEASIFGSNFKPCPGEELPEKFRPDDTAKACLVFLAPDHGDLVGTSFRPEEEFAGIVWTGEVTRAQAPGQGGAEKKDEKGDKGKKKGDEKQG